MDRNIKLKIMSLESDIYNIDVNTNFSVNVIKDILEEKLKIPKKNLFLFYNNKFIYGKDSLYYHDVDEKSVLYLLIHTF